MYTLIENQEGEMFAVSAKRIERFPMADSYGNYGQQCGHSDAGDSLYIEDQDAADMANDWMVENDEEGKVWATGDVIAAYEDHRIFDAMNGQPGFELHQQTVTGFNYHDGQNWASIIVDYEDGTEAPYSYRPDQLIKQFNQEINTKEQVGETAFGRTYETASFQLFNGNSAGDWFAYKVAHK